MKNSQSSFNFDEEPKPSSHREALLEQIRRDMAVLREDPIYHVPNTEFYEKRIASFRAASIRQTVE